jgi:hypothetical protein
MNKSPSTMYSGTLCDLCGGPTLAMPSGSIWCGAEDPHRGGHFVVRVAFERAPNKVPRIAEAKRRQARNAELAAEQHDVWLATRPAKPKPVVPAEPVLSGGYDDFVKSDR